MDCSVVKGSIVFTSYKTKFESPLGIWFQRLGEV